MRVIPGHNTPTPPPMKGFVVTRFKNEPQHAISNYVVCATSKGSDQPAHMRSLVRAFASRLNILLTEHHLEFLSLRRLHRLV